MKKITKIRVIKVYLIVKIEKLQVVKKFGIANLFLLLVLLRQFSFFGSQIINPPANSTYNYRN